MPRFAFHLPPKIWPNHNPAQLAHGQAPGPRSIKEALKATKANKGAPKHFERINPRRDGIRQSDLAQFLACRQKARLCQWFNLQPLQNKKHYFVHGSAYHDCLEKIYRGMRAGKIKTQGDVSKALVQIEDDMAKALPKDAQSREMLEDVLWKLRPVFQGYFAYYKNDFSLPWVTVEGRFLVDLAPGIKITGTMDGGYLGKGGAFSVFENKFRGRIDAENITDVLALDLQLSFYTQAAAAYGYPIGPRMFNIVKKPQQRQKKGEKKSEYSARILGEIMDNPKEYFFREPSPISPQEVAAQKTRLVGLCAAYLAWFDGLKGESQDPTVLDILANPGQCEGKYGVCEYLGLCAQGNCGLYVETDPQARKVQSFEDLPRPGKSTTKKT
jgi:hypothetical protein